MLPFKYLLSMAIASGGGIGSICWATNAFTPPVPNFVSNKTIQKSQVQNLNNSSNCFKYADLTKSFESIEKMGIYYLI